jgi:hypothetical protein
MLLRDLAFAHRPWQKLITNQHTGSLIKADHWIGWIIGQSVERQNLLKSRQECGINGGDAPGLAQMRL